MVSKCVLSSTPMRGPSHGSLFLPENYSNKEPDFCLRPASSYRWAAGHTPLKAVLSPRGAFQTLCVPQALCAGLLAFQALEDTNTKHALFRDRNILRKVRRWPRRGGAAAEVQWCSMGCRVVQLQLLVSPLAILTAKRLLQAKQRHMRLLCQLLMAIVHAAPFE